MKERIIEISKKYKLCHLGSCFSCLPILLEIYSNKPDVVILSNGHAGIALYAVLEEFFGINAEELYLKHGIHPCYDPINKIYCSTGSLGCGLPIAIGYALAGRKVDCIISDGEAAEGSIWESLAFITDHQIKINVWVNMNGFSAYKVIDKKILSNRLRAFMPSIKIVETNNYPFASDLSAHYEVL